MSTHARDITLYLCTGCHVVFGTAKRVGLIHTARCSGCGEVRKMHAVLPRLDGLGFREVRSAMPDDRRDDTMLAATFSSREGGA